MKNRRKPYALKKVFETHQNLKITAPYCLRAISHIWRVPSAWKNHFLWWGKIFGAFGAHCPKMRVLQSDGSEIGTIIIQIGQIFQKFIYIHIVFYEKYSKSAPNAPKDPILIYPHILIWGPLGALWGPWGSPKNPRHPYPPNQHEKTKLLSYWSVKVKFFWVCGEL